MAKRKLRLSSDVGRTITRRDPWELSDRGSLWVPGALAAVRALVRIFKGQVWLISKCGEETARRVEERLQDHRFFENVGLDPAQLEFCLTHEGKADIARRREIDIHLDDSPAVIEALRGVVSVRILFCPEDAQLSRFPRLEEEIRKGEVLVVRSWREARLRISEARQELLSKQRRRTTRR